MLYNANIYIYRVKFGLSFESSLIIFIEKMSSSKKFFFLNDKCYGKCTIFNQKFC